LIAYTPCNWLEWQLWFWFYHTHLKSVVIKRHWSLSRRKWDNSKKKKQLQDAQKNETPSFFIVLDFEK